MTPDKIAQALGEGYNIICATCRNHHNRHVDGSCVPDGTICHGPLMGGNFPQYNGHYHRDQFKRICLRCGSTRLARQVVVAGRLEFGLCQEHASILDNLVSDNKGVADVSRKVLVLAV